MNKGELLPSSSSLQYEFQLSSAKQLTYLGAAMLFEERMYVRLAFLKKMAECHGQEFQEFFHDMMCHRYPDFIDVRTAGSQGDMGSDGFLLREGKLYACYAPQTFDRSEMKSKYRSDRDSAIEKRKGHFDTFVFVCPDARGAHPEIPTLLVESEMAYPGIRFQSAGCRSLWNEVMRLDREQCEDLFGHIPISSVVYGIGLADLEPLLDHLKPHRMPANPSGSLDQPNLLKMNYNRLSEDCRERLVRGMRGSYLVQQYYDGLLDTAQHDEVAAGFSDYYRQVRNRIGDDPDEIMWELERYILGNEYPRIQALLAAGTILTHFFERCHIFEVPPPGWEPLAVVADSL